MAVRYAATESERIESPNWWRSGVLAGLAGGAAMAMVVMVFALLFEESGAVFDAPMAIWAWVFGAEHYGHAANHVWPIVLGMGAHFVNAVVVGLAFAALALATAAWRRTLSAVVLGIVFALVVWIAMRYLVLPMNDEEATLFTTDAVVPQWVWWLSHVAYGIAAGVALASVASRRRVREDEAVVVVEPRRVSPREENQRPPDHLQTRT